MNRSEKQRCAFCTCSKVQMCRVADEVPPTRGIKIKNYASTCSKNALLLVPFYMDLETGDYETLCP
jgi:hypothetical protein